MKKIASAIVVLSLVAGSMNGLALASEESYLYDINGKSVPAPAGYTVQAIYTGEDMGTDPLNAPADIFVDKQNHVYIADAGNNRIVVLDENFHHIRTISRVKESGDGIDGLNHPKGVFAAENGWVYICDSDNSRVIAVDGEDRVMCLITGENLVAVNKNIRFCPEKVAVDTEGTAYVVDSSIYQGILQYNRQGEFIGFFSPNEVKVTASVLFLQIWKKIFNSEQREALEKVLPIPYTNLYIDRENFLYTVSSGAEEADQIKHLNSLGQNILHHTTSSSTSKVFGDLESSYDNYQEVVSRFVDVHADISGMICGADTTRGRLFVYDKDCNLVTIFGGQGDGRGQFSKLVAIDKQGDLYLALDEEKERLTVFQPTEYMRQILAALSFYNDGLYLESMDLWQKVLEQNSHFYIAYRGIGRALLQRGEAKQAMTMLKKGGDPYFYSLALKDYRKAFVRENFLVIALGGTMALIGVIWLIRRVRRWLLSPSTERKNTAHSR